MSKLLELLKQNPELIDTKEEGLTSLHIAADRGYTDIIRLLLDHGADINAKTDDEDTALHLGKVNTVHYTSIRVTYRVCI